MTDKKYYEVTLQDDPDDPDSVILPLPDELLAECGWKPGDEVSVEVREGKMYFTLIPKPETNEVTKT